MDEDVLNSIIRRGNPENIDRMKKDTITNYYKILAAMYADKKLGLALSGGGFRASLFHLGVLKRLAELDMLRHVSVLSTVSGGSIIGALYILHLKLRRQTVTGVLEREDYIEIVKEVESDMRRVMSHNLRTQLFTNPFANLSRLCLGRSIGRHMARLYSNKVFNRVTAGLFPGRKEYTRRGIPLSDVRFSLDKSGLKGGLEGYNRKATDRVPKFILNATSLNTGRNFRFSLVELGDPQLGLIRFDEVQLVLDYKILLREADRQTQRSKNINIEDLLGVVHRKLEKNDHPIRLPGRDHLLWWIEMNRLPEPQLGKDVEERRSPTVTSPVIKYLLDKHNFSHMLLNTELGVLRRAKIASWYLLDKEGWVDVERRDGLTKEEHNDRLWAAIDDIDVVLGKELRTQFADDEPQLRAFLEFILDLYYFLSAQAIAWSVITVLDSLTLSDAVAASANFPPVFTPYRIFGIFNPRQVRNLALTDGGVYDNQGIDVLLEEEGCTHIIASDAGGLLHKQNEPATGRMGMMLRIGESLPAHVRDLQLALLRETRRMSEGLQSLPAQPNMPQVTNDLLKRYNLKGVAFFHMTSNPNDALPRNSLEPHPDANDIAELRTDLDAFNDIEVDALVYQGYQLCDRFVRHYLTGEFQHLLNSNAPEPPAPLEADKQNQERERSLLKVGHERFFRLFKMAPKHTPLVIMLGISSILIESLWRSRISLHSAVDLFAYPMPQWLIGPLFTTMQGVTDLLERPGSASYVVLSLIGIIGLWIKWPDLERLIARLVALMLGGGLRGHVAATLFARHVGLWRYNIWWLAGLLPLAVALLGSLFASVIWIIDRVAWRLCRRR